MKRNAFTLIELAVVVAIVAILAAILLPVFNRGPHHGGNARVSSCQSNLKMIGLAFIQYSQDYDEKLPPIANARAGYWAGSLQSYVRSWQVFQCPSDPNSANKTTDYYYNARVAETKIETLLWPKSTILSGEGSGAQQPLYHLEQLPTQWRQNEKSPASRHIDVANYLFIDGHVKWLKPEQVTMQPPATGAPTFLVR